MSLSTSARSVCTRQVRWNGVSLVDVRYSLMSSPAQNKSVTLSLVVAAPALAITTSSLPSGTKGSTYSNLLQANGGTAPYTWSVTAGSLPAFAALKKLRVDVMLSTRRHGTSL